MYILTCYVLCSLLPHAADDDDDEDVCGTTCIIIVVVVGIVLLVLGALLGILLGCLLHKFISRRDRKTSSSTELSGKTKELY